jgi:hypothetical protein
MTARIIPEVKKRLPETINRAVIDRALEFRHFAKRET